MSEQVYRPTTTLPEFDLMTAELLSHPFYERVIDCYAEDSALITLQDALQKTIAEATPSELLLSANLFDDAGISCSYKANGHDYATLRALGKADLYEPVFAQQIEADGTVTDRVYIYGSSNAVVDDVCDPLKTVEQLLASGEPFSLDTDPDDKDGELYLRIPVASIDDVMALVQKPENQQEFLRDLIESAIPSALSELHVWRPTTNELGLRDWVEVETMLEQEAAYRLQLQEATEAYYSNDVLTLF